MVRAGQWGWGVKLCVYVCVVVLAVVVVGGGAAVGHSGKRWAAQQQCLGSFSNHMLLFQSTHLRTSMQRREYYGGSVHMEL